MNKSILIGLTKKYLSWSTVDIRKGRTLVMANTRRKAANIFQCLNDRFPDAMYLSSGIRKKDRVTVLFQIRKNELLPDFQRKSSTRQHNSGNG